MVDLQTLDSIGITRNHNEGFGQKKTYTFHLGDHIRKTKRTGKEEEFSQNFTGLNQISSPFESQRMV